MIMMLAVRHRFLYSMIVWWYTFW